MKFEFIEADKSLENALMLFSDFVIGKEDLDNPFLVSFSTEKWKMEDAFNGKGTIRYFVVREKKRRGDGDIVARCSVNILPESEDIFGYGDIAKELYLTKNLATMTGDLVAPKYRGKGIQRMMIEERIKWLKAKKFDYVVAGIIEGNSVSKNNYESLGFQYVGQKPITWKLKPEQTDIVDLFGLDLKEVTSTSG